MNAHLLKLVKDIDNDTCIYYWACPEQGKVSPDFPTLLHASKWIEDYQATHYTGKERRQTQIGRRTRGVRAESTDQELLFSRRGKQGRRIADQAPVVELDLTTKQ